MIWGVGVGGENESQNKYLKGGRRKEKERWQKIEYISGRCGSGAECLEKRRKGNRFSVRRQ